MNVMPTKSHTNGTDAAPICSAYRLQTLCGTISPKTTIKPVVMNMPRTPAVASASNVAMAALTNVLPSSSVHNSKFPVFRSGWIFAALLRSLSSGDPSMTILKSSGAKDMRPRFRPEKRPLSATSTAAMMYCQTSMAAAAAA